ncbi:Hypothetical protein PBC10988_26820 [Planctomycetales bacterium 10988]|nr:Hypothetical protein PBC10988_26820 [Planctomycetales bacterium 10988]
MKTSLYYSLLSFPMVAVTYGAYFLLVVPWIEPPEPSLRRAENSTDLTDAVPVEVFQQSQNKMLQPFFGPNEWEVTNRAKIFQSSQGFLILQNYKPLPDGTMRIWPCSLVYLPNAEEEQDPNAPAEAIVLQAPEGAILQFDEPIDLQKGEVGKPQGGQLIGPVTIRQDSADDEKDLAISTWNLELEGSHIRTEKEVQFRLGPHRGQGVGLEIELVPGEEGDATSFEGLRTLQLHREVVMHFTLPDDVLKNKAGGKGTQPLQAGPIPQIRPSMEVQSEGPFRFDMEKQLATFEEKVVIYRHFPYGTSDWMICQDLEIFFQPKPEEEDSATPIEATTPAEKKALPALELKKLIARGYPVKMVSEQEDTEVVCEVFEWDEQTRWLRLTANSTPVGNPQLSMRPDKALSQISVRQKGQRIQAVELHVQLDEEGELLRADALGPGYLQARDEKRNMEAHWQRLLEFRPNGNLRKFSLIGKARVISEQSGRIHAEVIRAWMEPEPKSEAEKPAKKEPFPNQPTGKSSLAMKIQHIEAERQVDISSPTLQGTMDWLEVSFVHLDPRQPGVPLQTPPRSASLEASSKKHFLTSSISLPNKKALFDNSQTVKPSTERTITPYFSTFADAPQLAQILPIGMIRHSAHYAPFQLGNLGDGDRQFVIHARTVQAKVHLYGKEAALAEAVAEAPANGEVHIFEQQDPTATVRPMELFGTRLQVWADPPEAAIAHLVGQPARIESEELTLHGSEIELDRGKNTLWSNGRGLLAIPLNKDLEGNPTENTSPLVVHYAGGMSFNGQLAKFENRVEARHQQHALFTDVMEVSIDRFVRFSELGREGASRPQPEVQQVRCLGPFRVEGQTIKQGRLVSEEKMEASDLVMSPQSGGLEAQGPGWIERFQRGSAGAKMFQTSPIQQTSNETDRGKLSYLYVHFQKDLAGNHQQRQMTFHGPVETIYGPTAGWSDRLTPEQLGPRGVWMRCSELVLRQMGPESERWNEMEAAGNVEIEGQDFRADAARLSYTEAKELVILAGDATNNAHIWRAPGQAGLTGDLNARKILYWRQKGELKLEDGQSMSAQGRR